MGQQLLPSSNGSSSSPPPPKITYLSTPNHLIENLTCPFCLKTFPPKTSIHTMNDHLKQCGFDSCQTDIKCIEITSEQNDINSPSITDILYNRLQLYVNEKKHLMARKYIPSHDFETKRTNLKAVIKNKKISWEEGFCQLDLTRQNLLYLSMTQFQKIDLYKELKINFKGEVSYDAGGITREWFTMIIKLLEESSRKLFIVSDTNEFSYTINPFLSEVSTNFDYFTFLGQLIAKALLENITINVCFNKLIYKILLNEKVTFNDLVLIDSPLYHSLKQLKQLSYKSIEDLYLFYSVDLKNTDDKVYSFNLIPNGSDVIVKDVNDYIQKRIDFLIASIYPFVDKMRCGLFGVIPQKEILNLTSDEFELILNGRPFVDVDEWRRFTEYRTPYHKGHQVIKWFWDILKDLNQEQLSRFLQFCTGSARVPVGGFKELESNRGEVCKFTIMQIPYVSGVKNYIKAHTCFNRIEVPNYVTKEKLKENIYFLADNEIVGFGID